jgi:hypothetical protein
MLINVCLLVILAKLSEQIYRQPFEKQPTFLDFNSQLALYLNIGKHTIDENNDYIRKLVKKQLVWGIHGYNENLKDWIMTF